MSISGPGGSRPSKNMRREAAREKARALREAQKKKDRRNKFLLQGGIAVAVLAIIAVVVIVITSTVRPPASGPQNMASDGVVITKALDTVRTPALKAGASPAPTASDSSGDVFDIRVYIDYLCPICGAFEAANAPQIKKLVESGVATLEIHPIAILDRASMGTQYSTRAANAMACVTNYSPDSAFDYSAILFKNQPEESTEGLTNQKLIDLAKQAKVTGQSSIAKCINDAKFKNWVAASTARALSGPIPNSDIEKVAGTPTVLVNGQNYKYTTDASGAFNPEEFSNFLLKVAGDNYTQEPSPSPSPSVSPTP
ncbi:thioredoxin domain-containing protein [Parafrigoribacterium mesophilum]|uniref:DsbA family protein n=1 Tax=Parafrigoribacterium mesophilum TaxID=433646 RepID=UPI0031FD7327